MYYSFSDSLQVGVPLVAKSILQRKIKRSRGFSVSVQVSVPFVAKSISQRIINRSRSILQCETNGQLGEPPRRAFAARKT